MAYKLGKPQPLTRRQRDAKARAELHPVAWQMRQLAELGAVEGTPRHWFQALNRRADERARSSGQWPTTPNQLGALFGELSEGLELLGVLLSFRRSNGVRLWRCESTRHAAYRRHFEATRRKS